MPNNLIDRIKFTPQARPVDTVGVDTTFQQMAAPVRQANPLQPVGERLPARPVDEEGSTQKLIQALEGFSSKAGTLLDMRDEQQKKDDQLQAGFDAMKSKAQTWAEAVQANPELASKSPFYRDTFMSNLASTAMSKRIGEIQAAYYQSDLVNSTDPGAIQAWFTKQIEADLAKYTDPAEKRAALEVASNAARAFAEAHTKNATANLVKQATEATGARMTERLDSFEALPAAQPMDIDEFAAKDLSPEEQALLAGISAGESPGYDVRYGGIGSAGKKFALNGQHPNIPERTNDGRTSTAAGRYQFLFSTWEEVMGDAPFTPENQDRAALKYAAQVYKANGGGDLMEDLKKEGLSNRIQGKLSGAWESFKVGNRARFAATYNATLEKAGLTLPDAITADPNMDQLQTDLYQDAAKDEASGVRREVADGNVMQAVINKAIETRDPHYLKILDVKREGRPAISDDPAHRKVIQSTIAHIHTLQTTSDNAAREREAREHKAKVEQFKRAAFIAQEDRMIRGEDPSFSHQMIMDAAKIDSGLADKMRAMNEQASKLVKTDDPRDIIDLQTKLFNGEMTPDDVRDAFAAGRIKDPANISKFMEQARQNMSQSFLNGTPYRDAMSDINDVLGDPMNLDMEKAKSKVEAKGEVREAYTKWMKENPKALPEEQARFLHATVKAVLGNKADIDAWKAQKAAPQPQASTTQASAEKPSAATAATPAPQSNFDWRTRTAFKSGVELEAAWNAFRTDMRQPGPFKNWLDALKLSDPKDVARFYLTQRALLGAK